MTDKLTDKLIERMRYDSRYGDDTVLRESMKSFGWIPQMPALEDEYGRTLVGNRRKKIAGELGIAFVVQRVTFGEGDLADGGRIALALASNIGQRGLPEADRKRFAEYLYGERHWDLERIAKALRVGIRRIRNDLGNAPPPKSSRKGGEEQKQRSVNAKPEDWDLFRQKAEAEGKTAAEKLGELVREPEIDPATLPKTAQEKLAAAERAMRKRLEREFDQRLSATVKKMLEETILPHYTRLKAEADMVLKHRKAFMPRETFKLILSCLHPDSRANVSEGKLSEAFQAFRALEGVLVADTPISSTFTVPKTYDDLMAMRRRAKNGAGAKP